MCLDLLCLRDGATGMHCLGHIRARISVYSVTPLGLIAALTPQAYLWE